MHWEYWSFNAIYLPVSWYYAWLCIRARSFYFFNAANPSIEYGGFLMESKWKIHQLLPAGYTPKTTIVYKCDPAETVYKKSLPFSYPFICKPDIGSRGRGVAIINNGDELQAYLEQCPADFLIQENINYPMETGIFYAKIPGEATGRITGIVEKKYLSVTGDGNSTLEELVQRKQRYVLQLGALEKLLGKGLQCIPLKNEKCVLVPFGNHARGCLFTDASYRINSKLTNVIDNICSQVTGFYFGRLDIKFKSWSALENGEALSIIELNGSGSEPTHMYDPKNSILKGWKEIIKHWDLLYAISRKNHHNGIKYLTHAEAKKMFAANKRNDKKMNSFLFIPPPAAEPARQHLIHD